MNFGNPWFKENDNGMQFGISAPGMRRSPVETMAFNLWAMEETRKDELRNLAYRLATYPNLANETINFGLTQSEWQYVQDEMRKIRGGL